MGAQIMITARFGLVWFLKRGSLEIPYRMMMATHMNASK